MDSGNRKLTPVASMGGGESEQGETGAPSSAGFIEDPERKYHFECCSEEQCQEWMGALRRARWGVGYGLAWEPGAGAEPGPMSTGHFLPQLRVHAQECHLLQE